MARTKNQYLGTILTAMGAILALGGGIAELSGHGGLSGTIGTCGCLLMVVGFGFVRGWSTFTKKL